MPVSLLAAAGAMVELDAIRREAEARRGEGEPLLLATVVRVLGSSYRRPGARMLVGPGRLLSGCVSGGCLEDDVVRRAEFRLRGGRAVLVRYDSTSDDDIGWGLGVGCNGVVEILIERLDQGRSDDPLLFADQCFRAEQEGVIATVFASSDPANPVGARLFVRSGVTVSQSITPTLAAALSSQVEALASDRSRRTDLARLGEVEVFLERIHPVPHVFVIGTRHDARPLVDLVRLMGLRVTVVDRGVSVAARERFRDADRFVSASPDELGRLVNAHHAALAVLMTHDYERDRAYLGALLSSNARYIGVLGPGRRTTRMLAELEREGITDRWPARERLHAPVGLALGAETPREIALSIVAEMQGSLADAPAGRLRALSGPIHPEPRVEGHEGPVVGVLLAAGASRRLGRPKQRLLHRGEPLVRSMARELLSASSLARVGVVLGNAHADIQAAVADLPVEIIENAAWEEGMASSVRAAVRWASALGASALVITVVDQVRLSAEHLEALVALWKRTGGTAAASGYGGTLGVPAVFGQRAFDALLALEGDRGGARVLRALSDVGVVPWEDGQLDIDTPEDAARRLLASHGAQNQDSQRPSGRRATWAVSEMRSRRPRNGWIWWMR
jgi:xanthine/CO dehydrogenase XdhC/CoxF family maturation factor/CTP:molybdopterin cytidylyltransferase MocA